MNIVWISVWKLDENFYENVYQHFDKHLDEHLNAHEHSYRYSFQHSLRYQSSIHQNDNPIVYLNFHEDVYVNAYVIENVHLIFISISECSFKCSS